MFFKSVLAQVLCALLVMAPALPGLAASPPAPVAADGAQTAGKQNAEGILRSAERSLSAVVKAARESKDPKLAASAADAKPFWQALKKLNVPLEPTGRDLAAAARAARRQPGATA